MPAGSPWQNPPWDPCNPMPRRRILSAMSDAITHLNTAMEGRCFSGASGGFGSSRSAPPMIPRCSLGAAGAGP